MKALSFGEILWDIIEGNEHLGGAPFNFAAHVAQCGNQSFMISRLGTDFLGMRAYNRSKVHGVDVSMIQWDQTYPTGSVDVTLHNGQPDYVIRENVAYDFIESDTVLKFLTEHVFDVFYFGTLVQRNEVSANTLLKVLERNVFPHVFYDVNLRKKSFTEQIVRRSLSLATIFKLNNDEVGVISKMLVGDTLGNEEFCTCVQKLYPNIRTIIITASEMGCFVTNGGKFVYVPGTPVKVVDAVGAGDAFSASFMHVFVETGDAVQAASIANSIGAFVATRSGAIPDYSPQIKTLLDVPKATARKERESML
jgi:fructokinase